MKLKMIQLVLAKPWLVLLTALTVTLAIGYGATNLTFRGDYKVFFGAENPQLNGFEDMQKNFNKNDNVSIVIAPQSKNVFSNNVLTLIYEMTDEAWQTPYSTRVDSLTNYQHTEAEGDDLLVEDLLLDTADLTAEKIAKIKQISLNEPMLVHRSISPEGHVTMINVTVQLPEKNKTQEVVDITEFVRELVAKYQKLYPEVDFYLAGIVMMNNAFQEEAQTDAQTLIPGMFIAILLMLTFLLRSVLAMFSILMVIITSIVTTMGGAGWAGFYISTPTVNVPVLIMTLAVADCVHILASMNYNLRQGMEKTKAIAQALEINIGPIFITSATTAIGFLTFNFSDVPPLRDLGNMVAWGVIMAFLLSITLLPALLTLLPVRQPKVTEKTGMMENVAEWVIAKRTPLLICSTIFIIAMTSLVPLNKTNDIASDYFDNRVEFRQASDYMDAHLMGVSSIDFAIDTTQANGINDPAYLNTLNELSNWLRQQDIIDHVFTLSDTFKNLNKNMHGGDPAYYKIPENKALAAQYLLLYEMSLPFGLDLNNQLNIDKSAVRLTITMDNIGSKEVIAMEQSVLKWFSENAPQYKVIAASPTLMFGHIGERNMGSMLIGSAVAMVLISLLLVVALRSLKLGIISLLPNMIPAGIGFGFWALYSGNINLGLSIVVSMSLGIVVDDTVHFLAKYKRARMMGKNAEDAVRYAFASVGRALWITTLVLVSGFMVLTLSSFALNSSMGLLTALIILTALIVDFLFLPAFLILTDKKQYTVKENVNAIS